MASLTFNSQKNCDVRGSEVQQLKSKILALESETDILNRIISINDQTLEEINELVISHLDTLLNMGNHYINGSEITKGYVKAAEEGNQNSYEETFSIFSKMNQAISDHCDSFRGTLQSTVIDRNDDVNTLKKSLKLSKKYGTNAQSKEQMDCDTSIEEYTSSKAIFEVPIEVQLLKEVTDKYIQVDMANEHKHYIYEVPLQIHQIFQIPVELNQIFEVPVELDCDKNDEINRIFEVPIQINEVFEVFDDQSLQAPNIIQEIAILNIHKQSGDKESDQLYQMIKQLRSQIARLKEENQMYQYQENRKFFEIPVQVQIFGDLQLLNDPKSLYDLPLQIQIQSKEQLSAMNFGSQKQTSFKHVQSKTQTQTRTDLENIVSPNSKQDNVPIKTSLMMSHPIKYQPLSIFKQQHESQTLKDIKQLNLYVDQHVDCQIHAGSAEDLEIRNEFNEAPFQMEFYGDHVEIQMEVQVETQSAEQQTQTDFQQIPQTHTKIVKIPFIKVVQVPIQVEVIRQRIVKMPELKIIQVPVQQIISNIIQIPVQVHVQSESKTQYSEKEDQPLVLKSQNTQPLIAEKIQTIQTKTVIRQVPIEVIVQVQKIIEALPKIIVRQVPIEVIVQKIVQLPPIVILKQVPIEVIVQKEVQVIVEKIVEKIVEVPVLVQVIVEKLVPMIKEVPVEVKIEKIREIRVVEIKEVPIEVIVEKEVIRQVEKIVKVIQTKIKEVPIEVIVEKIVYIPQIKEVPIEVIVEKIVQVPQIKEIPIEVQVYKYIQKVIQKMVQIPIFIQIPIEMILEKEKIIQKKIPILRQIPTEVEIQKIIYIPVQQIRQVPIQVIVEVQKIKIVKQIVQVPVIMMINQNSNELSPIQNKNNQISSLGFYSADKIRQQQPIDYITNEENSGDIGRLRLQSNQPLTQSEEYKTSALEMAFETLPQIQIRQIPIELIMIEEIPATKNAAKIYQLPTEVILVEEKEKIVYVQKIVEVIVQKIVKVDRIIEIPLEIFIQKPIYIERQKIVEIPIEVEVEKEVIVYQDRNTEELDQVDYVIRQNEQIPAAQQENNVLSSRTFSYDKQHNKLQEINAGEKLEKVTQQIQADNMERISSFHLINNKTGMVQRHYEFPLNLNFLEKDKDIVVDISHMLNNQNQYEQIIIEFPSHQMNGVYMDASVQASEDVQQIQSSSIKLNSRNIERNCIQYVDNAVQTVAIQEKIKIMQIPIQLELEEQILQKDLQKKYRSHIDELQYKYQSEINELNKSINTLQSIIIESNQEKELLHYKIEENALAKQSYLNKYQTALSQVQELKKIVLDGRHQFNNRIYEVPIQITSFNQIYELPIQIILEKQGIDIEIQTQDIEFEHYELIQLPVQVERKEYDLKEAYFEDLQAQFQQEQLIELQNQMEAGNIENIQLEAIPVGATLKLQTYSQQIQTDLSLNQYEDIVVLRNTIDNPYETNLLEIHLTNEIQEENIMEQVTFSNPTFKQHKQHSSQTENTPATVQNYFYELPVEMLQVPQTEEASIQTQQAQLSQQSNKSCSSDEQYDEQMLLETEKNSNIFSKENKTQTNFRKRKPYSDYFRSRIFEIPIELNIKNDHHNIEIQTFDKKLESIEVQTQVSQKELDGLSQIWQSRQREAILSRLTLVPAFEAVALLLEQPGTPKKILQNKIIRLASQLSNPGGNQNFSHAQSLTPNQLDGSVSYQKFQPTININNISLIKKSSLHSQYNKFLGSLDMRQDLLNHDSAIASVRLNNKRLMGFDKQQSSSEQGDINNLSREMIIEQNETVHSRDINRIQTPNLEPHDLNFSEYATLKQKFYQPEEYKNNYQEMYEHSQNQIEGLKLKIEHKIEEVNELKIEIDQQTCRYQQQIRKLKEEVAKIQKESIEQYHIAENYRIKVEEITEDKLKIQQKQQILFERWDRLKDESEKLQISTNKEIERLRQIITEKMTEIKQLKSDQYHQKEVYEMQLVQFRQIIHQKTQTIDTLEQQLQRRSDRIDQLLMIIEEMRKNISNHASESDTAAIYQQQFVRVKQGFEQQKNELNYQLFQLKQQNQQLKNKLNDEVKKCQQLQQNITYLQNQLDEAKHDYSSLHHLKSELENNYMEGVKNLNQQLEEMKEIVREKEEFIYRIHPSLQKMAPNMTNSSHHDSPVRVQYLSKQTSQLNHETPKGLQAYTKRLEGLIKKYERIIIDNQNTIEDQQDKVYEYLKDALQKQQQAQGLYLKLVDYENTVNKILVEKVTLQVENKRLSKQMELSQKKLSVLGNRLIEVARQRAEYDSDDDVYYQ